VFLHKVFLAALLTVLASTSFAASEIRLILQITVDQLRGDLPLRHMDQYGMVAATLANKMGVEVPSSAIGEPLEEVVQ